ncbi:NADH-quinone oxidoreductase subunit L [Propioniciclava coleopterorum]|uniref:NADH-ubiquinone oxidoreductase chain 5 n=1 Tax=Propioniciclava coleopterorum TaxID=2714937 RepID=A0A6G7YAI5_9ACTN|nr:NADH-quinone oxidoreductase subunit L [Propioniciclava coleopterorum]QIK73780.1 NADH-quinone oxidoreductase subunit L [Propioniciclava coleopterorum]
MLLETLAEPVAATGMFTLAWTMIAVPLVMAGLLLLAGKLTDRWGHLAATAAVLWSFAIAACLFGEQLMRPAAERAVENHVYTWFTVGPWNFEVTLLIDQLSILFALLITGVGSLIHVYSIGYMAHDDRRRRFFAYLNLFIAAMLILVLANNYIVLFLGWEGVGLASYLLISFWQHKPTAAAAGTKAFVMNRVGDLGLLMAMGTMLAMFGSTSFADVNAGAAQLQPFWATAMGLFLLLAACGKSAQVPLQAWLLDAMEGPTPVSALIHAATMVTAGVYLVVRSHAVFEAAPTAQLAVVVVGTVTLLAGAWIGTSQDDIKKVLAGSTMSQIGYMMLAAGIGPAGYAFAIFHLLTHGFFKANMFLGAGSVMHGMNDDVNMRHYGGLSKAMRVTFLTFAMGYLAIIGFPFFAGYFSKDHIIEAAFADNFFIGLCALIGAGVTAFYMTRLMLMTFFGEKRWLKGVHPHESPKVMTIPLIILALFSIFAGLLMNWWIQTWLEPAVGNHAHEVSLIPTPVGLATLLVVALGVAGAWMVFGRKPIPATAPQTSNPITIAGRNVLFGDQVNNFLFVGPTKVVARTADAADAQGIDKAVDGAGHAFAGLSTQLRRLQTGYTRNYALTMLWGVLIVGAVLILGQLG